MQHLKGCGAQEAGVDPHTMILARVISSPELVELRSRILLENFTLRLKKTCLKKQGGFDKIVWKLHLFPVKMSSHKSAVNGT